MTNYQHPECPCIKVTRVNGRGYEGRRRAAKGLPYGSRLASLALTSNKRNTADT